MAARNLVPDSLNSQLESDFKIQLYLHGKGMKGVSVSTRERGGILEFELRGERPAHEEYGNIGFQ